LVILCHYIGNAGAETVNVFGSVRVYRYIVVIAISLDVVEDNYSTGSGRMWSARLVLMS